MAHCNACARSRIDDKRAWYVDRRGRAEDLGLTHTMPGHTLGARSGRRTLAARTIAPIQAEASGELGAHRCSGAFERSSAIRARTRESGSRGAHRCSGAKTGKRSCIALLVRRPRTATKLLATGESNEATHLRNVRSSIDGRRGSRGSRSRTRIDASRFPARAGQAPREALEWCDCGARGRRLNRPRRGVSLRAPRAEETPKHRARSAA